MSDGIGGAGLRSADALVGAVRSGGLLGAGSGGSTQRGAAGGKPQPAGQAGGEPAVLLLCSAGRDSACLLDVAVRVLGAERLHVLHVDHGLRGTEASDGDAACVAAWTEACGVGLTVREAPVEHAPVGDQPGNLHAWAREARRELGSLVAAEVGAVEIATAHTRTDLVETALGRFATQPGRRALLSMRAREGSIVRPLLAAGVTREETAAYCSARGIVWRDDPSNADAKYARARIRHGVLPVLRSLNPRAEEAITRTLAELAAEGEVLDALVDAELAGGVALAGGVEHAGGDEPSIALTRLAALPAPLARLVLRELCERSLGAPCPRAASRLDDVLALASGPAARAGHGAVDVGGGARLELRAGVIRCRRLRTDRV